MKLIFKATNANAHLPRKIKDAAKKTILQMLSHTSLQGLQKTVIGKHVAHDRDYAIYAAEKHIEYDRIFPNVKATTNYLAGSINHPDIFFLVDIGELVEITGKMEMFISREKTIVVNLRSILGKSSHEKDRPMYYRDFPRDGFSISFGKYW